MSSNPFDSNDPSLFNVSTRARGPAGMLPLTAEMLRARPSGDLFGWSQNAGMGWDPSALGGREFLMLSTHGGIRARRRHADRPGISHRTLGGRPADRSGRRGRSKRAGAMPFAAACTDPCDGRSQGTTAMFDSLPFRNDAATMFRRLIRSLPTRRGVLGVATCDKGLPAMMMALAASHDLPCVLVPGGVTLLPEQGEDAGKVQTIGVRFVHGGITLEEAADLGLPRVRVAGRRLSVSRHRRDLAGRRRSPRHVAGAFGARAVGTPHLARHGAPLGHRADGARRRRDHDARHPHRCRRAQRAWSCSRRSADRRI